MDIKDSNLSEDFPTSSKNVDLKNKLAEEVKVELEEKVDADNVKDFDEEAGEIELIRKEGTLDSVLGLVENLKNDLIKAGAVQDEGSVVFLEDIMKKGSSYLDGDGGIEKLFLDIEKAVSNIEFNEGGDNNYKKVLISLAGVAKIIKTMFDDPSMKKYNEALEAILRICNEKKWKLEKN